MPLGAVSDLRLDRDERKELYLLVARMEKPARMRLLRWGCDRVSHSGVETRVTSTSGEAMDVWGDLLSLAGVHGLDLRHALAQAAEIGRGRA